MSENAMDFLTPGSVWLRKVDKAQAKFLFLTNQTLTKPKTLLANPRQVVYADANGDIFSRQVESFFEMFDFHSVDGELEKRLERLIPFDATAFENIADPEDDQESVAERILSDVASYVNPEALMAQPQEEDSFGDFRVRFGLVTQGDQLFPGLTGQDLQDALTLYAQRPNNELGVTEHHLTFSLEGSVNLQSLEQAFVAEGFNTFDWFTVNDQTVVWEAWRGVYPEYARSGQFATVIVATFDQAGEADEPTTAELAAAEEVAAEVQEGDIAEISNIVSDVQPAVAEAVAVPSAMSAANLEEWLAASGLTMSQLITQAQGIQVAPAEPAVVSGVVEPAAVLPAVAVDSIQSAPVVTSGFAQVVPGSEVPVQQVITNMTHVTTEGVNHSAAQGAIADAMRAAVSNAQPTTPGAPIAPAQPVVVNTVSNVSNAVTNAVVSNQ